MQFASDEVTVQPDDRYATLVHGDFKAMNVMLPMDESDGATAPMLIDFASTGVGLGMCDVAMLLAHSVAPSQPTHAASRSKPMSTSAGLLKMRSTTCARIETKRC